MIWFKSVEINSNILMTFFIFQAKQDFFATVKTSELLFGFEPNLFSSNYNFQNVFYFPSLFWKQTLFYNKCAQLLVHFTDTERSLFVIPKEKNQLYQFSFGITTSLTVLGRDLRQLRMLLFQKRMVNFCLFWNDNVAWQSLSFWGHLWNALWYLNILFHNINITICSSFAQLKDICF